MKGQWTLIVGIAIALIIATFAVINVDPVEVNYLIGQSEWPLVLIILGSVLMGGIVVGSVGMFKIYQLQQQVRLMKKKLETSGIEDAKNNKTTPNNKVNTMDPIANKEQKKNSH